MVMTPASSDAVVFFGATGDLAHKKIFASAYTSRATSREWYPACTGTPTEALMTNRIGVIVALIFGAAAIVGCGGASGNTLAPATAVTTTAADEDAAAGLREHHRYH